MDNVFVYLYLIGVLPNIQTALIYLCFLIFPAACFLLWAAEDTWEDEKAYYYKRWAVILFMLFLLLLFLACLIPSKDVLYLMSIVQFIKDITGVQL